jgi:hypothetical protein
MLHVALMVDRNGLLNVASLDVSSSLGWQGPDSIGTGNLLVDTSMAVFQPSATTHLALMIDRTGVLNTFSLDSSSTSGWQGPITVGNATLVPGAPITVFQQTDYVYTALMVDRFGVLNSASLDTSSSLEWDEPNTLGSASLVPGSPVTVCQQSPSVFAALMVDRNGLLNVASLDLSRGAGWQGPDTIGNSRLAPGSRIAAS